MPIGLIVMKWSSRLGAQILDKYPKEIQITDETLMQIYASHEYGGEGGIVSFFVRSLNITSFYAGPEKSIYVILLLNLEEDPDEYEDALINGSRLILKNLQNDSYKAMIPSIFQRISAYPKYNDEQKLSIIFNDEINRLIINRLREEGVFSKSELKIWLKDVYRGWVIDIDTILLDLIKKDIIKESSVKGTMSEMIFLLNDLIMLRRPPIELYNDPVQKGLPEQFIDDYRKQIKNFFEQYTPNEKDNLKILEIILDPEVYLVLKLLRKNMASRNMLEKLKARGVDDIDETLKKLYEAKMINVFQDKSQTEYYSLISDFYIGKIYPKYILNNIIQQYGVKSKSNEVLLEYLNVLQNNHSKH
ncbi:MAG: hypothetical protein KGD63_12165 [Candidatus Lokiarchaeota archaeon]|nr:hypothetical protein [Candidatus Lokiarchaeota archaeon]